VVVPVAPAPVAPVAPVVPTPIVPAGTPEAVASAPVPTPAVRVNQAQITKHKDGVKREEIKEIRENTNKNRNFTRNIPARRGH
jgi:hypothetical protein